MTACALAHRLVVTWIIVAGSGVAHGSLSVVKRAGDLTQKRHHDIIFQMVAVLVGPLHVFKTKHPLEVEQIGISAVETGGFVHAVKVKHETMTRGSLGGASYKFGKRLVITVHEIDLETLYTHIGIMLAHSLHILVKSTVSGP